MGAITVTQLAVAAVKGTHLRQVDAVDLSEHGARGDRRFFLIDERSRLVNGKLASELQTVDAIFDEDKSELSLSFSDGRVIDGRLSASDEVQATVYGEPWHGKLVDGPWAAALSVLTGRDLRLVITDSAVDRGPEGAVSLMSRASLARLSQQADSEAIDGRRFRMLIEVDGIDAHVEDGWVGRSVRIGEAILRFEGHVGRCRVTTFEPDTGESNLPTLDLLRGYRADLDTTEPLAFGVFGRVLSAGRVTVGDELTLQ